MALSATLFLYSHPFNTNHPLTSFRFQIFSIKLKFKMNSLALTLLKSTVIILFRFGFSVTYFTGKLINNYFSIYSIVAQYLFNLSKHQNIDTFIQILRSVLQFIHLHHFSIRVLSHYLMRDSSLIYTLAKFDFQKDQ